MQISVFVDMMDIISIKMQISCLEKYENNSNTFFPPSTMYKQAFMKQDTNYWNKFNWLEILIIDCCHMNWFIWISNSLCALMFKTHLHLFIGIFLFPIYFQNKWDSVKFKQNLHSSDAIFEILNGSILRRKAHVQETQLHPTCL